MKTRKKVPELRFPEFSGEWEEKRLGEVSICLDNKRVPINSNKRKKMKGNIPYYGANGIQGYVNDYIFDGEYVLLAEDGGRFDEFTTKPIAQYVSGKCWVNNHAHVLKANNCSKYLFYVLVHKDVRKYINGTSRTKLNQSDMKNIIIDFPSLPEQQKIGNFFFTLDKRIELQQQKVENLEKEKKWIMQKIFSQEIRFKDENGNDYPEWEEKKLGEVAKITNGNSDVQDASIEYVDGYYPFFDRSNIIKYLDTYLFDNEAIIYPGEGKDFLPRYYKGKYALHQRCYAIYDADEDVDMNYLCKFLETQNSYFQRFAVGSTVPSLRMDTFVKANIRIPSLPEQQKIANFLSAFDNKIEKEREKLEQLRELKRGLLQQMFV